jgi:hypothetical protein
MADEQNEVEQPSPVVTNNTPEQVVVEGTPVKDEPKVDPATDFASSALPYHTAETEKIAADRAEEIANAEPKPYRYEINDYVVTEEEGPNPQATTPEDANKLWKVTSGEFVQFFGNKRAAEIFAETHSPQFAKNATAASSQIRSYLSQFTSASQAVQDVPKT